eukprot:164460-Prymnesium_polylepis.1
MSPRGEGSPLEESDGRVPRLAHVGQLGQDDPEVGPRRQPQHDGDHHLFDRRCLRADAGLTPVGLTGGDHALLAEVEAVSEHHAQQPRDRALRDRVEDSAPQVLAALERRVLVDAAGVLAEEEVFGPKRRHRAHPAHHLGDDGTRRLLLRVGRLVLLPLCRRAHRPDASGDGDAHDRPYGGGEQIELPGAAVQEHDDKRDGHRRDRLDHVVQVLAGERLEHRDLLAQKFGELAGRVAWQVVEADVAEHQAAHRPQPQAVREVLRGDAKAVLLDGGGRSGDHGDQDLLPDECRNLPALLGRVEDKHEGDDAAHHQDLRERLPSARDDGADAPERIEAAVAFIFKREAPDAAEGLRFSDQLCGYQLAVLRRSKRRVSGARLRRLSDERGDLQLVLAALGAHDGRHHHRGARLSFNLGGDRLRVRNNSSRLLLGQARKDSAGGDQRIVRTLLCHRAPVDHRNLVR